jgi:UDPglucose 6-dehydrogenase
MKIGIIGIGKLGLCFGLNLSKAGNKVIGYDINEDYVNSLNNRTFNSEEENVNKYLKECPFKYTYELDEVLKSDIIFIIVPTPSKENHKYDHSYIEQVIEKIILSGKSKERKDLVINSTTFPGYCQSLYSRLEKFNYTISYNPEFIAQGTIIRDQVYCDNILIGSNNKLSIEKIKNVYNSFVLSNPTYNVMGLTEAEITKLSVNCFLTTKISFANMIGDISKKYSCNPDIILKAIGTDSRIGGKYLNYGFGYGGPCFPRDNRALSVCAKEVGIKAVLSEGTDKMNQSHLENQLNFIINNFNPENDVIEIEYLTFKKESDSFEESQQLEFAKRVSELGFKIKLNDKRENILEIIKNKYKINFV